MTKEPKYFLAMGISFNPYVSFSHIEGMSGGRWFDPCHVRRLPTGWIGVSVM